MIGLDATDGRLVEGAPQACDRRGPIVGMHQQLGEQRVVLAAAGGWGR